MKKIEILEEEEMKSDMYDRQKRISGWDQTKISKAKVMVVGAGATGNELVKNLALAGIGTIFLVDFDTIEPSNLNRCVFFTNDSITQIQYKADAVKNACKNLNSKTEILPIKKELNAIDKSMYQQCDVICSCLDNLEARIEANNYAYYNQKPFIDSGIDELFGSVQVVYSEVPKTACLQCGISDRDLELMWERFSCTGQEIAVQERIIPSVITTTSIIGGIQAQQFFKILFGIDQYREKKTWNEYFGAPLVGKQLIYNGIKSKFNIITKQKDDNCWICSSKLKARREE